MDGHTGEGRREEGEGREGHRQFCPPKFAHKLSRASESFTERNPWFLPIQSLRTGREQHVSESSNHSLHLMKLVRDTAKGISTHNTPTTTTHLPSLPSLSHTHTHTRTHMYHAYMYMHVYLCMCVYAYLDVYVHVYVYVFFVCVCVYVYDLPQWFHVCATSLIYILI